MTRQGKEALTKKGEASQASESNSHLGAQKKVPCAKTQARKALAVGMPGKKGVGGTGGGQKNHKRESTTGWVLARNSALVLYEHFICSQRLRSRC